MWSNPFSQAVRAPEPTSHQPPVAAHIVRHGLPFPAVKICDAVDKDYAPRGIIPLPDPEAPLRVSGSSYVEGFSQYTIEFREKKVFSQQFEKTAVSRLDPRKTESSQQKPA